MHRDLERIRPQTGAGSRLAVVKQPIKGSRLIVINPMLINDYLIFDSALRRDQRKPHEDDHHTCRNWNVLHERDGHVGL